MGFLTDLITDGWDAAYWNHECKEMHRRLGIPVASPYQSNKSNEDADTTTNDSDVEKVAESIVAPVISMVSAPINYVTSEVVRKSIEDGEGINTSEDENSNLSAYTKVHWDESIE